MKHALPLRSLAATLLAVGFGSTAQAAEVQELDCGANWGPIAREAPVYPRRARARGIEGYIVMSFTITTDGSVENISVIEQEPRNTFVRSATRAIEALRFPPCMVNGSATEVPGVQLRYTFQGS